MVDRRVSAETVMGLHCASMVYKEVVAKTVKVEGPQYANMVDKSAYAKIVEDPRYANMIDKEVGAKNVEGLRFATMAESGDSAGNAADLHIVSTIN